MWPFAIAVVAIGLFGLKILTDTSEKVRQESEDAAKATLEMREQLRSTGHFTPANEAILDNRITNQTRETPQEPSEPPPYTGPIFAPQKNAVKFRVKKSDVDAIPSDPDTAPLHSKEVALESLPYFKKKVSKRAETLYRMGQGLEKAKKPEAALKYYDQVVTDFPDSESAKSAEQRIKFLRSK